MCGIVAYSGPLDAAKILIHGLKKLEYRGYDSAGLSLQDGAQLSRWREVGKIRELESRLPDLPKSHCGIAHTRWATHGPPTEMNAHPHHSANGKFAVVHNGIIENYQHLRRHLESKGYVFASDTDTECIAHLLEDLDTGDFLQSVRQVLNQLSGTYGIAVLNRDEPGQIIAARSGSPLVLGICSQGYILASDPAAVVSHTQSVLYLDEGDILKFSPLDYEILSEGLAPVQRELEEVPYNEREVMLGGYSHFMQKEIFEQPLSLANSMRGRIHLSEGSAKLQGLELHYRELRHVDRIILCGCGTSYYAALAGEYLIEELAGIPVEVELASEFRYRNPILSPNTLVFCISQSGETADTLAALREAKRKGSTVLGICNVVGSSIARESDGGVYLHAGPEIGVASTKAFSSQVVVMALVGLLLGRQRQLGRTHGAAYGQALMTLPEQIEQVLELSSKIRQWTASFANASSIFYLGRGILYPVALEGALKLKETSYINAQAYSLAELKHGPLALVDDQSVALILIPKGELRDKVRSGIMEVRSRGAKVYCMGPDAHEFEDLCISCLDLPHCHESLQSIVTVVALQILAYEVAVQKECDVDQPRNLAKSVTVE